MRRGRKRGLLAAIAIVITSLFVVSYHAREVRADGVPIQDVAVATSPAGDQPDAMRGPQSRVPEVGTCASSSSASAVGELMNNQSAPLVTGFVQRAGVRFVVSTTTTPGATTAAGGVAGDDASCKTFYFSGWNTFYCMHHPAGPDNSLPADATSPTLCAGRQLSLSPQLGPLPPSSPPLPSPRSSSAANPSLVSVARRRFPVRSDDRTLSTTAVMVRAADPKGRCEVLEILDKAKGLGLTVVRTWAFSDGPLQWNALQRAPGEYDENTFAALDWVVHQASIRGMYLAVVHAETATTGAARQGTARLLKWRRMLLRGPHENHQESGCCLSSATTGSTLAARISTTNGPTRPATVAATVSSTAATIFSGIHTRYRSTRSAQNLAASLSLHDDAVSLGCLTHTYTITPPPRGKPNGDPN